MGQTKALDVVNSPVNVAVVAVFSLVFNVSSVDGNLTSLFFRSAIDIFVGHGIGPTLFTQDFGDGLGQRSLNKEQCL